MAALLRYGARRVSASVVQRTQAAFTTPAAAGERRLLTTEVQRTQAASTTPAAAGDRRLRITEEWVRIPPKNLQDFPPVVQERKEMLYDKIAFMERVTRNNENRELLRFLSVQVKPRPDDSLWRWMRASKRMKDAARAAVLVSGCTLGGMVEGKWMTQNAKKQVQ